MQVYNITLENYSGDCQYVTVRASDCDDAWAIASERYPNWSVVEAELNQGLSFNRYGN